MPKITRSFFLIFFLAFFIGPPMARAEELQCEVMSMEGSAFVTNSQVSHRPLKEGDILKADDLVDVDANSYVDLGYDRNWQNVTRIEERSKVEIKSLFPTSLKLAYGGVFAKLKELPKESTFEVETPTAIASVRGTEYRTVHEQGATQVYNFSDSQVYVFGEDEQGSLSETPVIVANAQTTRIAGSGAAPSEPKPMAEAERVKGGHFNEEIGKKIQENISRGRFAKVPDMQAIKQMHRERMAAMRSGQGKLVSMGQDQNDQAQMKVVMGREDRMLRLMDNANQTRQGKPAQAQQGQVSASAGPGPQNAGTDQSRDQLKKNDQGTISQNENGSNPAPDNRNRKPRPGNLPPPPKPPR